MGLACRLITADLTSLRDMKRMTLICTIMYKEERATGLNSWKNDGLVNRGPGALFDAARSCPGGAGSFEAGANWPRLEAR